MKTAPLISTLELIKQKREMVDSLLEIEIAYSMMKDDAESKLNPVDQHYEKLKTDMKPLVNKFSTNKFFSLIPHEKLIFDIDIMKKTMFGNGHEIFKKLLARSYTVLKVALNFL
jgi:poly [ADP-ribose] polymerase